VSCATTDGEVETAPLLALDIARILVHNVWDSVLELKAAEPVLEAMLEVSTPSPAKL